MKFFRDVKDGQVIHKGEKALCIRHALWDKVPVKPGTIMTHPKDFIIFKADSFDSYYKILNINTSLSDYF